MSINSYFVVKNLFDFITSIVYTTVCVILCYYLTNQTLETPWRLALYLFSQLTGVLCAQSIGFVIGIVSVFTNSRYTSSLMATIFITLVVLVGYIIPMNDIKPWLKGNYLFITIIIIIIIIN